MAMRYGAVTGPTAIRGMKTQPLDDGSNGASRSYNARTMIMNQQQRQQPSFYSNRPSSISPTATTTLMDDDESKKPRMDEIVAMALVYRRLALVLGAVPIAVATLPVIFNMSLGLVNLASKGYGPISLLLTAVLTWIWYASLKSVAPSPEKLHEAYQKSKGRLPLALLIGSCLFLRFCVVPLMKEGNNSSSSSSSSSNNNEPRLWQWIPGLVWSVGLRPALGLVLMGFAVLVRFVGPSSMVRCSTIPLIESLHTFQHQGVLSVVAGPANTSEENALWHQYGGRYQRVTTITVLANMTAIAILGYATGESIFVPYWHVLEPNNTSYESAKRTHLLILSSGILTMLLQFWFSNMNWFWLTNTAAHELNPKKYYSEYQTASASPQPQAPALISAKALVGILSISIGCAMFSPLVSLGCISLFLNLAGVPTTFDRALLVSMIFCCGVSGLVGFYVAVLDEASKTAICTPGMDLERCVRDANMGRAITKNSSNRTGTESTLTEAEVEAYVVDTMLHSILHEDDLSVLEIRQSTASKTIHSVDLARYEAERNTQAVNRMAMVLLGNKDAKLSAQQRPERPLEEDTLRHSILESLGGSITVVAGLGESNSSAMVAAKSIQRHNPSERHNKTIRYWLTHSLVNTPESEPKGVILVRALCAYTGGMGQSLMDASHVESNSIAWLLPAGAIAAAEYAVIALSRCLVMHWQRIQNDWRSYHMSMLIAAALSSAYRLRKGIFEYARFRKNLRLHFYQSIGAMEVQNGDGNAVAPAMDQDVTEQSVKSHAELGQLLSAIDEAIDAILQQLEVTAGTESSLDSVAHAMDKDCAEWIRVRRSKAAHQ